MPPASHYAPDDAGLTPAALEFLASPAGLALRAAIENLPTPAAPTVAQIAGLRKKIPQTLLHAALTLAALQPKAREKFAPSPAASNIPFVYATPEALEQATAAPVAAHKASRFAAAHPSHIYDLCAGIGGDTLALAAVAPTTAIDLSETRLTCLRLNAATQIPPPKFPLSTRTADLQKILPTLDPSALFHIDPARRSAGRRSIKFADLIPGPDTLKKIIAHFPGGTVKLSPATDFADLPQTPDTHLELVSHHRTVVQALLHTGTLATVFPQNTRTATVITPSRTWSYSAAPAQIPLPPVPPVTENQTLYELDGALTRAQLAAPFAAEHNLVPLTPDGGYLLSSDPALADTLPCLTPFTLLNIFPYSDSAVEKELHNLSAPIHSPHGPVEVKSRGHLPHIDADALQIALSKITPHALTLLIFRHGHATYAALAARPQSPRS